MTATQEFEHKNTAETIFDIFGAYACSPDNVDVVARPSMTHAFKQKAPPKRG